MADETGGKRRRGGGLLPAALVALLVFVLAGCGVSASSGPADEGDALSGGSGAADSAVRLPPSPDSASTAEVLVRDFLHAASGGKRPAIDRVRAFLTPEALGAWRDPVTPENPPLTVVRVVRGPVTGVPTANRTPVIVDYQMVGSLTAQGRVDELTDLVTRQMKFWVVPDEQTPSNLRVDEIDGAPPGLLLSDDALTEFYRIQPVYFWDTSYSVLVPDLRYLPLTITTDQQASQVMQWLVDGPSPWLAVGAQRLPTGTTSEPVVTDNGKLVVKLNAAAAAGGPEGLQRLLVQVQWSLPATNKAAIEMYIEDKLEAAGAAPDDYLHYNLSTTYRGAPQRYDITAEQKVIAVSTASPAPPPQGVLAAPENQNVVSAAVSRNASLGAFVRVDGSGRRYLQVVRAGAGAIEAGLAHSYTMGRPAFVPGADVLLIASAGQLYAVSVTDGSIATVTPRSLAVVTAVSVAPDGRRVAFVAGGQVYVSLLSVANNQVMVSYNVRPILNGQITATAVAWTDESWLDVAGTAASGPALWRVTADGVVAQNVSESLKGLTVTDVVAYPHWPSVSNSDVFVNTPQNVYTLFTSPTLDSNLRALTPEASLRAPFFGS